MSAQRNHWHTKRVIQYAKEKGRAIKDDQSKVLSKLNDAQKMGMPMCSKNKQTVSKVNKRKRSAMMYYYKRKGCPYRDI